jgi:tripartite-type tricarboxylate transporter receptor subunit TctC
MLARIAAMAVAVLMSASVAAADYPTRPIRIIIPLSAGSATDMLARMVGPKLVEAWGQPVVVDNRPSAGGTIAGGIVAGAAPDGHTLMFASSGFATAAALYPKLPYDPLRDFRGVTLMGVTPFLLVVPPSLGVKSVKELIALARQNPGKYSIAALPSSSQHLGSELFKLQAGIDLLFVPYKGNAAALTDLLGGQVQVMFNTVTVALPYVHSGKLRALAAAGVRRSKLAPDLPTVSEAGVPGFSSNGWYGIVAPAHTPRAIIARLSQTLVKIVRTPAIVERMASMGNEPVGSSPEEFDKLIREEIPKWAKVIKEAGITLSP